MPVVNFASETVFESNTTSGNVSLSRVQLEELVDGNYISSGVILYGTDILALDVDLGERIAISDIRYYFSSVTASGAVASGIDFYYKDYESDPWTHLTTTIGTGYYTTTSGNFFPRLVRVVHTISGTGVSGTLHEYEVNSNEDIVDYGSDGTLVEKDLQDTPFGTSDPYTIPVYNDGDRTATAYVYIGNTDSDADEMLRISQSQNGTYIGVDDGPVIDNSETGIDGGINWDEGSRSNLSITNDKLELNSNSISYSSNWQNVATTLDNEARPACIAWHDTDPWQSVIYYIHDWIMYKYELATGLHVSVGSVPKYSNSLSYGGNNDLVYDPIGNRIYYFLWDDNGGEYDHLFAYYFDIDTGLWSARIVTHEDWSNTRRYTIRGAFLDYPGSTNSKDGKFEVGERYIVVTISAGHSTIFRNYRLRLSDHDWSALTTSGYNKHTGDYTGTFRACGICIQEDNLGNYPTGTVAVIWSYAGSTDTYEYINAYAITDQTGVAQSWAPTRIYNISPRDPSIDSWFASQDFTGRGKFFFYDDGADKLYFASSYNNDCYSVWYNIGGQNLGEGTYRLYRSWDCASVNFYDSNMDNAYLYGDGRRYDEGLFRFMARLWDEQIWMYFPTGWSGDTYQTNGTYTTPAFQNIDPTYWRVKAEIPENTQIATTSGVVASTIEVRSTDTTPEMTYYMAIYETNGSYFDIRLYNESGSYTSLSVGSAWWLMNTAGGYYRGNLAINPNNDTYYCASTAISFGGHSGSSQWEGKVWSKTGSLSSYRNDIVDFGFNSDGVIPRKQFWDNNDWLWVITYAYADGGDGWSPGVDRIYRLYYNLGVQSYINASDRGVLRTACLDGDGTGIWYHDNGNDQYYRLNSAMNVVTTIDPGYEIGPVDMCEDGEGGFWVGENANTVNGVQHWSENGTLITTIPYADLEGSGGDSMWRVEKDFQGGCWVLDGHSRYVYRINANGQVIKRIYIQDCVGIMSDKTGVWGISGSGNWVRHYTFDGTNDISYSDDFQSGRYDYQWQGVQSEALVADGDYMFPAGTDSHWSSLEWKEVSKDTHFLHHKKYHQARVTLRSDGSDTPSVEKIALPPNLELANIPSQGSRNAFMKTVVASGTQRSVQHGKIRTWFDMEE